MQYFLLKLARSSRIDQPDWSVWINLILLLFKCNVQEKKEKTKDEEEDIARYLLNWVPFLDVGIGARVA